MDKVVIIGAGPAGVRAAETLVENGIHPIVLDEAPRPGGQIYRQPPDGAERPAEALYGSEASKAQSVHAALGRLEGKVDYRPGTLVWNCFQGDLYTLNDQEQGRVAFDRLILATGAFDRIIPYPGWTLPGAFTLGAAQIALKSQGLAIGGRVVLAGSGPLLPLVASQYLDAGADVAAIIDVTPFSAKIKSLAGMMALPAYVRRGFGYLQKIRRHGGRIIHGVEAIEALGDTNVTGFRWKKGGRWTEVTCDAVGASFGLKPEFQLAELAGCDLVFDEPTRQWLPNVRAGGRSSLDNVYLAGDGAAIGGADVAELTGKQVAYSVLADMGRDVDRGALRGIEAMLARHAKFRTAIEEAYPFPVHLIENMPDSLMLCRCEGVTVGQLRANYVKTKAPEINRLKAHTRVGMGRCQGRVCGAVASELLAELSGRRLSEVGRLRGQHPVKPIPILV